MSETLFKVFGITMLALIVLTLIRKSNSDIGMILRAVCGVVLATVSISLIRPVIDFIEEIGALGNIGGECVEVLLRVLGISVLSHIASGVCRDCGETSLASYVDMAAKAEILIISIPLMKSVLDIATDLLNMSR